MTKEDLVSVIDQYAAIESSGETHMLNDLKNLILTKENCFDRYEEDGAQHIAASVLLLTADYQSALFLYHTKIQKWTQPGGHADGNISLPEVALAELEEETGVRGAQLLQVKNVSVPLDIRKFDYSPEIYGYRKSIYNFCYVAILPEGQEPHIMEPDKCEKMVWATAEEALDLIKDDYHEGTQELLEKWQSLIKK